jgi:hypothetical protein
LKSQFLSNNLQITKADNYKLKEMIEMSDRRCCYGGDWSSNDDLWCCCRCRLVAMVVGVWCLCVFCLWRERERIDTYFSWEEMKQTQSDPYDFGSKFTKMPFRPIDLKMRSIWSNGPDLFSSSHKKCPSHLNASLYIYIYIYIYISELNKKKPTILHALARLLPHHLT